MPQNFIKLPTLKCHRCGYEWYPRAPKPPKVCPNRECKSPYWDRPRKKASAKK